MIYIGAAATAVLFILQIVGIISISGWLIAAPLLLAIAWGIFWFLLVLLIAAISNM